MCSGGLANSSAGGYGFFSTARQKEMDGMIAGTLTKGSGSREWGAFSVEPRPGLKPWAKITKPTKGADEGE